MSKWCGLDNEFFTFVDLGRPAVFLLPVKKILQIEENLHRFLIKHFGTFTYIPMPSFGAWRSGNQVIVYDECRLYEVSFVGKEKITLLARKLAQIATAIQEECIYFKAGQYAALIYPK
ncbi:MAG: hypothetical protein HYT93_03510 [Parcubacteria group bacterium]|nr:hypothetical protein [Parcubacteria group bacterium]